MLLLLCAACGGGGESTTRPPDVILIVCDTLRADRLSCHGYARATTPAIDRFAETATRWARAYSTAPWTLPAHASLFTGLFPFEHGAHTELLSPERSTVRPLAESFVTIAEAMQEEGYETRALVANDVFLAERMKLNQGFDRYVIRPGRAWEINSLAVRWLEEQPPEEPLFLFLNYMDTHRRYHSEEHPGLLAQAPGTDSSELLDELYGPVLGGDIGGDDERLRRLTDQYDTAVANLDEALGRLFARLEQLQRLDDALIILTSDHGEYFGEHALIEHSKDVYEQGLRVPLIVERPGQREGRVEERRVSLTEIPSFIVSVLPASARARWGGTFPGDRPVLAENYYSRTRDLGLGLPSVRFQRVRRALLQGDRKLIHSSDGGHELYDLDEDPLEGKSLVGEGGQSMAELLAELKQLLERRPAGARAGAPIEWTQGELERMGDLGY